MIDDVLIVGAGPAGCVAAVLLARAGVRVRLVDRAVFPRDKLCGDTVNPGALARLRHLDLAAPVDQRGLQVDGMRVTGPRGVAIDGRYPDGVHGRALTRRDLDWAMLQQAIAAGAHFDPATTVRRPIVDDANGSPSIGGVVVAVSGRDRLIRARATIAADGRRSALAFALGLARHPPRPRRWAIGAYYENAAGLSSLGEMHIRLGRYIGVAPIPGGLANVCLVKPSMAGDQAFGDPAALLAAELARDPLLRDRFAAARLVQPPVVLGPLAVEAAGVPPSGLLLAGDAAGFIDPMTGDGLRFAVHGAELAAAAALESLSHGWNGVHERLARARHREFAAKWRFNRTLRALVASPRAVDLANLGARIVPSLVRRLIATAGDCGVRAGAGG
ncbi:MAG: NAD(P)/FAD-dependent oxidoreductase [Acidobacteriota bacterium]